MRLLSRDTPMRFSGTTVEWVDTEPVAGAQGYELKSEAKAEDEAKSDVRRSRNHPGLKQGDDVRKRRALASSH